jgi:hypothetical protein
MYLFFCFFDVFAWHSLFLAFRPRWRKNTESSLLYYYALHAGGTASPLIFFQSIGSRKKTTKLTMTTVDPESAAQYGLTVNQNHRYYQCGTFFSIEKKLEVA